jgi:TorA maturation chaperone TorD
MIEMGRTKGRSVVSVSIDYAGEAVFCRFLGYLYIQELNDHQLDVLRKSPLGEDEDAKLYASLKVMRDFIDQADDARKELAVEYASVFLGAGKYDGRIAAPYESVFTSPHGIVMQEARDEVVACYRAQGFAVNEENHIPEDHLAFELEFVSLLLERMAEADKSGESGKTAALRQQICQFIQKHILNWLPTLEKRVDECSSLVFYPAAVRLTDAYLSSLVKAMHVET